MKNSQAKDEICHRALYIAHMLGRRPLRKGKDYGKSSNPRFPKIKEPWNNAAKPHMLIHLNTPSTGLQIIIKKVLAQRLAFRQGFE